MIKYLFVFLVCSTRFFTQAQVPSPSEFLGYELGAKFTPHEKVLAYFRAVSAAAKNVKLESYGKTTEGRDLIFAVVSDSVNIAKLEQLRINNLKLTEKGKVPKAESQPVIVWLSYNVHGNEASSTETAMKVFYHLAVGDRKVRDWLKNTVVIIDPCLNPDGRTRYVNFFNGVVGSKPNPDPKAREHHEPWPSGRGNHYYFDLNRDWAWQTQVESLQRVKEYRKWMPQVHVDFHEQDYNEPYYFAPAAEPVHQSVTKWQRDFQELVGKNNAKYFDENGWKYFTKEKFDLLYPSYGDTYPLYNGAIGMTYEQGGIGAGLAVITEDSDTLTLKDRIAHHFSTSMSTIEISSIHAKRLVTEFKLFFDQSLVPQNTYKSFVIKASNISRLKTLADLLTKNGISFAFGGNKQLMGYNFNTQKIEAFKLERNDMVINIAQKHGVLANVLLEPHTFVADTNTYDITAWALPYAYGLPAYALKQSLNGSFKSISNEEIAVSTIAKPYAWVLNWGSVSTAKALNVLQQKDVKVRVADESFTSGGTNYPQGTLLIFRLDNENTIPDLKDLLANVAEMQNIPIFPLASGYVDKGKDFGSGAYRLLVKPKVAVYASPEVSSLALGEVWSFFEQELGATLSIYNDAGLSGLDFSKINTFIVPGGEYNGRLSEHLLPWVKAGGKLILLDGAVSAFVGRKDFGIKFQKDTVAIPKINAKNVDDFKGEDFSHSISGAIYKLHLNTKHYLSYGIGSHFYTIKADAENYQLLENGHNAAYLKKDSYSAGLVGAKAKGKLSSGMLCGVQKIDKGEILYVALNPLFRHFWEGGKILFLNALYF